MAALATLTRRGGALCASAASSTPSGLFYQASRSLFVKAPGNPTQARARARALFLAVVGAARVFCLLLCACVVRTKAAGAAHRTPTPHACVTTLSSLSPLPSQALEKLQAKMSREGVEKLLQERRVSFSSLLWRKNNSENGNARLLCPPP